MYLRTSFYTVLLCLNALLGPVSAAEATATIIAQATQKNTPVVDPIMQNASFQAAIAAYQKEQFKEAEQIFQKLFKQYPGNPLILNNLAVTIAKQGKYDQAIQFLKDTIASDEVLYTSYQNLSAIYAHEAADAYRRALSLSIDSPEPLHLTLIGQAAKSIEIPLVTKKILKSKEINQPLVQDPEAPTAIEKNTKNSVTGTIMRWAQAWSDRDMPGYFASYYDDYAPTGKTHQEWKVLRIQRLRAPATIQVTVSNVHIEQQTSNKVTATFRQNYHSNLLQSTVTKRLQMARINNKWKITDEKVLR